MICNRFIQFLTLNLILCICTPSLGDIIHVPDDYETIQEAIENASDGDTVLVSPGTYPEGGRFNYEPELYIIGSSDPEQPTIIDLEGRDRNGFAVQYATGHIENFLIRDSEGAGIYFARNSGSVKNCIFKDLNSGIVGTDINDVVIENCVFDSCEWTVRIRMRGGPTIIRGSLFANCTIGIDIGLPQPAFIENNTFINTRIAIVTSTYGGLYRITNNIITGSRLAVSFLHEPEDGSIDEVVARHLNISYNCLWNNEVNYSADLGDRGGAFNPTPGTGMLYENPLFADPEEDDFHLQEDSPCINAGDPESDIDPDGTCADIGAFYFHLYPDISVEPEALEFTDLQIGTVDSSLVSIQN
ncbi:MAG: right-handed parallel beta-helix repeat-containing protein, partial [Candidatus Hatepunaea meridiana]|nr:right-handed parallel beta-helix repeat-containing protein [Candidatus Hatepunaea meridiana]